MSTRIDDNSACLESYQVAAHHTIIHSFNIYHASGNFQLILAGNPIVVVPFHDELSCSVDR
ncbi:hypothetical protein D3C85_1812190 [compost metagenome]